MRSFYPICFELHSLTNHSLYYATSYCGNACGARRRNTTIFCPFPRKSQVYSDCLYYCSQILRECEPWAYHHKTNLKSSYNLFASFCGTSLFTWLLLHRLGQQKRAEWQCRRITLRLNQDLRPLQRWMVASARRARNLSTRSPFLGTISLSPTMMTSGTLWGPNNVFASPRPQRVPAMTHRTKATLETLATTSTG